jgi:hypothetical protein
MGIMMGAPHFVQGVVARGGRSAEMKTLVWQEPHVTMWSDFLPGAPGGFAGLCSLLLSTTPIYHQAACSQAD